MPKNVEGALWYFLTSIFGIYQKMIGGPFVLTYMRFPGIRLVEKLNKDFVEFEFAMKKNKTKETSDYNSRAFCL